MEQPIAEPAGAEVLSIVVPAFNEEARVASSLERLIAFFEPRRAFEILVVDDGSRDGTAAIVSGLAERCPSVRLIQHVRNQGKGAAIRTGMLEARGTMEVFSDADLPLPPDEIERMASLLEQGYDVIIASRGLGAEYIQAGRSPVRRVISRVFNRMVRRIFSLSLPDTQCGVKCFRREAGRAIFSRARIDSFAFDVEVLILAKQLGCSIAQVPVRVTDSGLSTVRLTRHAWEVSRDLWRIRQNLRDDVYAIESERPEVMQDVQVQSLSSP